VVRECVRLVRDAAIFRVTARLLVRRREYMRRTVMCAVRKILTRLLRSLEVVKLRVHNGVGAMVCKSALKLGEGDDGIRSRRFHGKFQIL
jgi:hypothetical protein